MSTHYRGYDLYRHDPQWHRHTWELVTQPAPYPHCDVLPRAEQTYVCLSCSATRHACLRCAMMLPDRCLDALLCQECLDGARAGNSRFGTVHLDWVRSA